mmetsp:Transcript_16926/g.36621  ORF Transcript_16926/g.36621 Transcript_16926/m.36621 type:complete len:323 (-) Transcript_16926:503-1471(-)
MYRSCTACTAAAPPSSSQPAVLGRCLHGQHLLHRPLCRLHGALDAGVDGDAGGLTCKEECACQWCRQGLPVPQLSTQGGVGVGTTHPPLLGPVHNLVLCQRVCGGFGVSRLAVYLIELVEEGVNCSPGGHGGRGVSVGAREEAHDAVRVALSWVGSRVLEHPELRNKGVSAHHVIHLWRPEGLLERENDLDDIAHLDAPDGVLLGGRQGRREGDDGVLHQPERHGEDGAPAAYCPALRAVQHYTLLTVLHTLHGAARPHCQLLHQVLHQLTHGAVVLQVRVAVLPPSALLDHFPQPQLRQRAAEVVCVAGLSNRQHAVSGAL